MKDKLEKAFNQALDNHELPYDAAAWNAVKKQLPAAKTPWYWMGGAAAVVVVVVGFVLLMNNSSEHIISEQKLDDVNANQTVQTSNEQSSATMAKETTDSPAIQIEDEMNRLKTTPNSTSVYGEATNANTNHSRPTMPLDRPGNDLIGVYTKQDNGEQTDQSTDWLLMSEKTTISGLRTYYCQNGKVVLFANQVPPNTEITWLLSDGREIKGEKLEFEAIKGLQVRMRLLDLSNKNSIQLTEWTGLNVLEAKKPEVDIVLSQKNTKNYALFSNSNHEIDHLIWHVDGKVIKEQSCGVYMTSQGSHQYTVESYDKNGCFASVSGSVEVTEDYNLYVQSGFTPNGDGLNDVFMPEALKSRSVNFQMTIFDRNGKVLFETSDASQPWDGTSNGQTLEPGAYVWSVTLMNEEGFPEQYRGVVTLLP